MEKCNFVGLLSITSNIIAIITFLFIVFRAIMNYRISLKLEKKFKVPHELLAFDFNYMIIETAEYLTMLIGIVIIVIFIVNIEFKHIIIEYFHKYIIVFACCFLYLIGTFGVVKERFDKNKENVEFAKESFCCSIMKFIIIYVMVPIMITFFSFSNKTLFIVIIVFMFIIAIICVILYVKDYLDIEHKKYRIIVYQYAYYAIITFIKNKFVLVKLYKKDECYFVDRSNSYIITDQINLNSMIYKQIK